jgi:hypothetical protein
MENKNDSQNWQTPYVLDTQTIELGKIILQILRGKTAEEATFLLKLLIEYKISNTAIMP